MDEKTAKEINLDVYIEWMISNNFYSITTEENIYSHKTKKLLKPFLNKQGYYVVNFTFCRKVVRQVKVHRVICVNAYGAESVKEKQVAHLDRVKTNNKLENLWVTTPKEHVYYDKTHKNLIPKQPKKEWKSCSFCKDKSGIISKKNLSPDRISGKRFNVEGTICRRCYKMFLERERRSLKGNSVGNRVGRKIFSQL